jgi:hypothetical protein
MNNDVMVPKGAIEGLLSDDHVLTVPMTSHSGSGYACKEQSINKWYNSLSGYGMQIIQDNLKLRHPFVKAKCWTGFMMCMSRDIANAQREDGNLFDPKNINTGNDDDLAKRVQAYISLNSYVEHLKGVSFGGKIAGRNQI